MCLLAGINVKNHYTNKPFELKYSLVTHVHTK